MTVSSDYTKIGSTMQPGYTQQYRIMRYLTDVLRNWLADPNNIKDPRIAQMLYNAQGDPVAGRIVVGTPYDPDGNFTGTTPSITTMLGQIQYILPKVNVQGNTLFALNPMQAPVISDKHKLIQLGVMVVTKSYDGTVLLAELVQMFLTINSANIVQDCQALDSFQVQGVSAISSHKAPTLGNAKQVYQAVIRLSGSGHVSWTRDTQGPVFKHITYQQEIK